MAAKGGKREGAGRPPLSADQKRIRVDVRLTAAEVERLRELGKGNLSKGIRKLLGAGDDPLDDLDPKSLAYIFLKEERSREEREACRHDVEAVGTHSEGGYDE